MFVAMVIYSAVVHGFVLCGMYAETAHIWRSQADMMTFFPVNLVMKALIAFWFVFAFAHFYRQGGWQNGVRFGVYFGVFAGLQAAFSYYYLPVGPMLAVAWFLTHAIEYVVCGALVGAIYCE
jgi:hypothetical protein